MKTGGWRARVRHFKRLNRSDDRLDPDITNVAVVRRGTLRLTFADGLVGEVDVLERMHGPVFSQARSTTGFERVSIDAETGTVVWPGDTVLAPDTLYERVRTGIWPDQNVAA